MAVIKPFRAWRFHPELDLEEAVAPLLENEFQLASYYDRPYNAVHLTWPQHRAQAAGVLADWKAREVLVRDPLPAVYPYYQSFARYGSQEMYERKGFICMARLNPPEGPPAIIVHEDTIKQGMEERLEILERTRLNATPTHGLYEDPGQELEAIMDAYMAHPMAEIVDAYGVRNQLGMIQHPEHLARFMEVLRNQQIYLADGHHRLETSHQFRDQRLPDSLDSAANYHMMYLSNLASSDGRILPTHRLAQLPADFDVSQFIQRLTPYFYVCPADRRTPVYQQLAEDEHEHAFGIVLPDRMFLLRLRPDLDVGQVVDLDLPESVKRLDYTLLHYLILDKALGIPYPEQAFSKRLSYHNEYATAMTRVEETEACLAVIVKGISLQDMLAVCREAAIMPQKSTYFYPKVLNGLVFASIDDAEQDSPFDTYFEDLARQMS